MEAFERAELTYAPLMVFTSTFIVGLFGTVIGPSLTWYALTMTVMDAVLSFVLTLVFMQAIPLFTFRKKAISCATKKYYVSSLCWPRS